MCPADRVVRRAPLALIDPDPESGFLVRDARNGLSLAWRHDLRDAAAVTAHLNALYPAAPWPGLRGGCRENAGSPRVCPRRFQDSGERRETCL